MNYWLYELSQTSDPSSAFRWRPHESEHGPYSTAREALDMRDAHGNEYHPCRVVDDNGTIIDWGKG